MEVALSNSFGFGGHNVTLAVREVGDVRIDEHRRGAPCRLRRVPRVPPASSCWRPSRSRRHSTRGRRSSSPSPSPCCSPGCCVPWCAGSSGRPVGADRGDRGAGPPRRGAGGGLLALRPVRCAQPWVSPRRRSGRWFAAIQVTSGSSSSGRRHRPPHGRAGSPLAGDRRPARGRARRPRRRRAAARVPATAPSPPVCSGPRRGPGRHRGGRAADIPAARLGRRLSDQAGKGPAAGAGQARGGGDRERDRTRGRALHAGHRADQPRTGRPGRAGHGAAARPQPELCGGC